MVLKSLKFPKLGRKSKIKKRKMYFFFSNVIDTPIYRSLITEFTADPFDLHCIFVGPETSLLYDFSHSLSIPSKHIQNATKVRFPFLILSYMAQLFWARPKIVFCFGQTASILGLLSALISRNTKRFYLRCHTSMNKVEDFPRGVYYDKLSNFLAQQIVVPNINTRAYLEKEENVDPQKLVTINFGFDLTDFDAPGDDRINQFLSANKIPTESFVIGIASRFTHMKGLQYSLPAIGLFIEKNPQSILIMTGFGEDVSEELTALVEEIPNGQIRMIPRTTDMPAFYKSLSAFVHTPIDETVESYGLVYVEAFAAGVPSIFTISGIAKDIAIDGFNCITVNYTKSDEIEIALNTYYTNTDLVSLVSANAKKSVVSYSLENMCEQYRSLIG